MSSIISDIFYGSKQNLLDNYLIHRANPPNESGQQATVNKQQANILSQLEFVIDLQVGKSWHGSIKMWIEMGNLSDQNFSQQKQQERGTVQTILRLCDLEQVDLNKYQNLRISISEGKGETQVQGFIPIQTIKSVVASLNKQKLITLQLKGKGSKKWNNAKCTIRAQTSNKTFLNSNILGSANDQTYMIPSRDQPREDSSINIKIDKKHQINKYGNRSKDYNSFSKEYRKEKVFIDDKKLEQRSNYSQNHLFQPKTQLVRQLTNIRIAITSFKLLQNQISQQQKSVKFQHKQEIYQLKQTICLKTISKEGVTIKVILNDGSVLGTFHLNPLLLSLNKIVGQIPIYSEGEQCIGTVTIKSAKESIDQQQIRQKHIDSHFLIQKQEEEIKTSIKDLIVIHLNKIVLVKVSTLDISQDCEVQDQIYNFSKMQNHKLELIIRVNGIVNSFSDIVVRTIVQNDNFASVQIMSKSNIVLHYYEDQSKKGIEVEIQLLSRYRVVAYARCIITKESKTPHYYLSGDTSTVCCRCSIHLQTLFLQPQSNYFRQSKLNQIFQILSDIVSKRIKINSFDDNIIKQIMELHKKVTYVEIKKLMGLLNKQGGQLGQIQSDLLMSVFNKQNIVQNQVIANWLSRLFKQFIYIDSQHNNLIQKQQFMQIIQFFEQQGRQCLQQNFDKLIDNAVYQNNRLVYPFLLAGQYLLSSKPMIQMNESEQKQINQSAMKENQFKQQKTVLNRQQVNPNIVLLTPPTRWIQTIIISNANILNKNKPPNITLSITKKIHYACSNPRFIIDKEVNLMQPISVYHKNIAEDRIYLIGQFLLNSRQSHYQLQPTGRTIATVAWTKL